MREPSPAKLICGLISSEELIPRAEQVLAEEFGEIDLRSKTISFNFTSYYEKELGDHLFRRWVSFERLIPQDELGRAKLATIQFERGLARENGLRRVNLDPGYVTLSKLLLVTTKDYSHRVYLGGGVFAEVTLIYKNGRFLPLEWTYPDYRTDVALSFFRKVRCELQAGLSCP